MNENTNKISETKTENIIREYYGTREFIEKTAIPNHYGFKSKKQTENIGYPDFLKETEENIVIIEAKAIQHSKAEEEVKYYMTENKIENKDIIGIAVSGQHINQIKVTYYYKIANQNKIETFMTKDTLLTIEEITDKLKKHKYGESLKQLLFSTIKV